nr:hypothetical protein [Valsa mali var. pyri (nom. inval.)]
MWDNQGCLTKGLLYYFFNCIFFIFSSGRRLRRLGLRKLDPQIFVSFFSCLSSEVSYSDNGVMNVKKGAHKVSSKSSLNSDFVEWFVGLCEAESNFLIRIRKNDKGGVIGFEFVFKIALHHDDRNVIEFIKKTLNCGRLNTERNTLVFTIFQLSDIETILIPLFEGFPLNTIKFLDYLAFK